MSFSKFELIWLCSIILSGAMILGRMGMAVVNPAWNATKSRMTEERSWFALTLILWIGLVMEFLFALLKKGV